MAFALSFEQAPPLSVPYRFLLTAPWFGVAAGLLLAFAGEGILASRWSGASLAFVHLLTAGLMLQAMSGALLQFIPVATGGVLPASRRVAAVSHPALLSGALVLVAGFLLQWPLLFSAAVILLGLGGGVFVVAAVIALWQPLPHSPTLSALRVAVAGLGATLLLGVPMAAVFGGHVRLPLFEMTFAHAAAGFGIWGLALLAGVCFYVVPMFQLTPRYPSWIERFLPAAAAASAGMAALLHWQGHARSAAASLGLLLLVALLFVITTLVLQQRRRRRSIDATFRFFRLAMLCGAGGALAGMAQAGGILHGNAWLTATAFLILGAFMSAINGMLYKIVPFINWLHLQRAMQESAALQLVPNMKDMIREPAMLAQWRCHVAAIVFWIASPWRPSLAMPAGLLLAASSAWLGINLLVALKRYRRFRARIPAVGSGHAPSPAFHEP